jgi:hypothetical protein
MVRQQRRSIIPGLVLLLAVAAVTRLHGLHKVHKELIAVSNNNFDHDGTMLSWMPDDALLLVSPKEEDANYSSILEKISPNATTHHFIRSDDGGNNKSHNTSMALLLSANKSRTGQRKRRTVPSCSKGCVLLFLHIPKTGKGASSYICWNVLSLGNDCVSCF